MRGRAGLLAPGTSRTALRPAEAALSAKRKADSEKFRKMIPVYSRSFGRELSPIGPAV